MKGAQEPYESEQLKSVPSPITISPACLRFTTCIVAFLPLYRKHREYFYDWCEIGSLYGAPVGLYLGWRPRRRRRAAIPRSAFALTREYGISARLTFSNSLLRKEHLSDARCNALCRLFEENNQPRNGVIVHSELLLSYLRADLSGAVPRLLHHQGADGFSGLRAGAKP